MTRYDLHCKNIILYSIEMLEVAGGSFISNPSNFSTSLHFKIHIIALFVLQKSEMDKACFVFPGVQITTSLRSVFSHDTKEL